MKKLIVFLSVFIIIILIAFNCLIGLKVKKNNDLVNKFNDLIINNSENSIKIITTYPSIEYNKINYNGFVRIKDSIIPIEKKKTLFKSAYCIVNEDKLIIKATNLKNSLKNCNSLEIGDTVCIINMLGEKNEFKVNSIKRTNKYNIDEINNDLVIIINNYNEFNKVLILCDIN